MGYFVLSGNYVLPMYKGAFPKEILPNLKENPEKGIELLA